MPPIENNDEKEKENEVNEDQPDAEAGEDITEIIEALLKGRLDQEYPLTQKIVRIFTSSTFTGINI